MSSEVVKDDNDKFDETQLRKSLNEIQKDISKLLNDLNYTYNLNPNNQHLHNLKMKSSLVVLESLDSKLFDAYNSLTSNNEDDLASNFGISVKLDMAKENLDLLKQKHSSLNKEWHSQDKHLNKIADNIAKKESELKSQSALCTIQGLTMGKVLWRLSKNSELLEVLVSNDKLALELIKIYSGCLYGFIHTFGNDLPDPLTDEYQFVVCLTGIINNFGSIPDGRFFLLHEYTCREVLNQIIKTIPFISIRNGEELKFLTLSTIYNIMICQEGVEFMQNNCCLMHSLKNCLEFSNSERIILMSLKIITTLLKTCKCVIDKLDSPLKQLKKLSQFGESHVVRTSAKEVLTLLQKTNSSKNTIATDTSELIHNKSMKLNSCRKNSSSAEQATVTCCVVTDTNIGSGFSSKNQTATFSEICKSVVETRSSSMSSSSTSETSVVGVSHSFPLSKYTDISNSGSEPITRHRHRNINKCPYPAPLSNEASTQSEKSGQSRKAEPQQDSEKLIVLENLNSIESEEIQNLQYQFPFKNMENTFSITIGDHLQNPRTNRMTVQDGHHTEGEAVNTSTVTVYRVNNSHLFTMSENAFFPFTRMPQCDAQSNMTHPELKATQELTNIIEQEIENVATTSKETSDQNISQKLCVDSTSSNEDNFHESHSIKLNKQQKRKRSSKKKRTSEIPVFKIPFRGRRHI